MQGIYQRRNGKEVGKERREGEKENMEMREQSEGGIEGQRDRKREGSRKWKMRRGGMEEEEDEEDDGVQGPVNFAFCDRLTGVE